MRGFMIESYLEDGRQDTPEVYGKSITIHVLVGLRQMALFVKSQSTFVIIMILDMYRLAGNFSCKRT